MLLVAGCHRDQQRCAQRGLLTLLDALLILAATARGLCQQGAEPFAPLPFEQDELPGGQGAVIRRPQPGLEDIVEYLAARSGLSQTTTGVTIQ